MAKNTLVILKFRIILCCIFFMALALASFSQNVDRDQKINPKETKLLIDSICKVLNRLYIFPDAASKISNKLNSNYKSGLYNTMQSRTLLAAQLSDDIQKVHKDPHMKISYFPDIATKYEEVKTAADEKKYRDVRLARAKENYFGFIKKEILPGNVGYMRWDYFDEFVEEGLPVFDSCFKKLSTCSSLIIDLRENNGGNSRMVYPLQNYFFHKRTAMNHTIDRSYDTVKHFTDTRKTKFKLSMPVYILSGHATFSAGEDFTYGLQQAKRAHVVGDITGGGAHPTNDCILGHGFIMAIPTKRAFNEFSKTDWELTGIIPDEPIEASQALNETLLLIYKKLIQKTKNEAEQKLLQSCINDIKKGKYAGIPFSAISNSDALHAIEIKDSIYGPTNVGTGYGSVMEYHEKTSYLDHGKPIYINEENSAWFKLSFDHDTLLTFDLVPTDPSNDYDFIFFKCSDNTCVENIKTRKQAPDRSCHSGFASYNGATGISNYGFNSAVGLGPGPAYVRSISVTSGETYYLMVNYGNGAVKENNLPRGFTIYFHDYWPKKKPAILNNVTFNSNETILLPGSFAELDKLALQLNKDKSVAIEIRGHADGQGTEEKNMELSIKRAQAVKDCLVSKHVDAKRLLCKGFGSSKPIADNLTEASRKKNRRVEFAVIMR